MFRVPLIIFNGSSDRQAENFNHKKKKKKRICLIQTFGMLSWCAAGLLQGRKWLEAPKLNRVSLLVINVPPKKHLAKTKRRLTVKQCRTVWNTIALSKYTKQSSVTQ